MSNTSKVVGTLLVVTLAACSRDSNEAAARDEFSRDLQLASATTMAVPGMQVDPELLNSLETKPRSAPEKAPTVKRGSGDRAVRSEAPTVAAAPEFEVAAAEETYEVEEVVASAPVPEVSNEPAAVLPRPSAPAPVVTAGAGDYGGSGNGGIFGGVVIRGGGVDGDHCEIHARGRTRGGGIIISRGPIYTTPQTPSRPTSTGTIGMGTMRGRRGR